MRGKKLWTIITAVLVAALVAGLTTTAATGAGDSGATAAKKKKKKKKKLCPAGTKRVIVKVKIKKTGKKKKKIRCQTDPAAATTPGPNAALTINPSAWTTPNTQHGGQGANCPDCPVQAFTVTNTGTNASGPAAVSIQVLFNTDTSDAGPWFFVISDSCSGVSVPAGGACSLTLKFAPRGSGSGGPNGDNISRSILHVIGSPGGDAQAALAGFSTS